MWMKTLDGADVYENGDGWVFLGREQKWLYEPNMLTMPPAPVSTRVKREVDSLKGGWPTLRGAWSLDSPSFSIFHLLLRIPPLAAALYFIWHIPVWIKYNTMPEMARIETHYGVHQVDRMILLGIISLTCLWILWVDHVYAVDKKKGQAIVAVVFGGAAILEVNRYLKRLTK